MKHKPNVDDREIVSVLSGTFHIEIRSLDFLPLGEDAWVFKGEDSAKRTWFIKLARENSSVVEQVTAYLHDTLQLGFIAAPIASKGSGLPRVKDYDLVVYPFIEGDVLGSSNLSPFKTEIGNDLRRLHDATLPDQLRNALPREPFEKFQDSAQDLIGRARQHHSDGALMTNLAKVMEVRARIIDDILKNARTVSDYCRAKTGSYELVVCHSDIHPYNIMNTPSGLMIVDWDGIMLAPRERDLMFYADDMRSATDLHQAYGMEYQLDKELITYYAYEWVLQEFTDYLGRIFDSSLGTDARHHALEEFERLFGEGKELGGVVKDALDSPLP